MFTNLLKNNSEIKTRQLLAEEYSILNSNKYPDTWKWDKNEIGIYFIESSTGKKRYSLLKVCQYCERNFCVRKANVLVSNTCSNFCSGKLSQVECKKIECAWCKLNILRRESRLKKSKSGLYFCDRKCKEKAQEIGGLKQMQLAHYKDGASSYSERAFKFYGLKCFDCEVNFKPLLSVHHIDGDRENGDISNLEVVCMNHHLVRHMFYKKDKEHWVMNYKKLTPRNKIKDINKSLVKN